MSDDFCKEFAIQQEKYMIKDTSHKHRNKPNRMSDAEIMVILILFHSGGFRCFKHYIFPPVETACGYIAAKPFKSVVHCHFTPPFLNIVS